MLKHVYILFIMIVAILLEQGQIEGEGSSSKFSDVMYSR